MAEKMLPEEIQYKGFKIIALTELIAGSGKWDIGVCIERHTGADVSKTYYYTNTHYGTREKAIRECLKYGKRIVNGKGPGLTANDL